MPNFRHRLTPRQQRIYDKSNATSAIRLGSTRLVREAVAALPAALATENPAAIEATAQRIADGVTRVLRVRGVAIRVRGTRPRSSSGELHGLYTPADGSEGAHIEVWMRTAKRKQVVAFKTFLRTVLHEICHHLDYVLLRLPDSFHTDGFYQRESSLFHQIGGAAADAGCARPVSVRRQAGQSATAH